MNTIGSWLFQIYVFLALVPFLVFPLMWLTFHLFIGDKKLAVHRAMDVTTLFLIGIVAALYDHLFGTAFKGFWIIALIMLLLAGFLGNAQNRKYGEVDPGKLFKSVWRLSFLFLSFFYVIFFLIGLAASIMNL